MSSKQSANWDKELINKAKFTDASSDRISMAILLFYYELVISNYEKASAMIENFKKIPVTKEQISPAIHYTYSSD